MKIKDYKCKCGKEDFFFADKGYQKGIYCSYCGKWLKWADKDEQNLAVLNEEVRTWIPVSKRLPKVGEDVLVTRQLHFWDQDEPEYVITTLRYAGTGDENPMFLAHNGQYLFGVTAWMPLPEPYKEKVR